MDNAQSTPQAPVAPTPVAAPPTNPAPVVPETPAVPGTPAPVQTTPPMPPTPETPAPAKKGSAVLIVAAVLLLLSVLGAGAYYYYTNYYSKPAATYTPMPTAYDMPSPSPSESASPSASPSGKTGKVTGTICYPSSGVPAGTITAKNTVSNKELTFDNALNMSTLSLDLEPGTYKFKYTPTGSGITGFATECTGNEPACQNNTSKRKVTIYTVSPGETTTNIKICDYYYLQGLEPDF